MKHKKRIAITFLIVAAGCVLGMFYFSNQNGDTSHGLSYDIVLHILKWLSIDPDETITAMNLCDFVVRKIAHFTEYTVLGIGLCGLMRVLVKRYWGIAAIVLGAVLASLDEFHQLFIPGRSAMVSDVVIDTCGVVVGSIIFTLIILLQEKKRWNSKK
ncbi:VanZ family protein [uncultured Agathobaculum sp.]|uniref:VanZ family protein n=1 Tax=uncultured Agathobaculum sp. TaxID=2048140 RepID=UPI00296E6E18